MSLARPTGDEIDGYPSTAYFESHLNSLFKFNIISFNYIFKRNYIVDLNSNLLRFYLTILLSILHIYIIESF